MGKKYSLLSRITDERKPTSTKNKDFLKIWEFVFLVVDLSSILKTYKQFVG